MAVEPVDFDCIPGGADSGAIALIRPTVTAFIGRTAAGPVNDPIRVGSVAEFERVFGGHVSYSFVPQAVQHYFEHGGGEAVVVRVANRAARARIDIPAGGGQALALEAVEPGSETVLRASVDHERVETQRDKFNLVVQQLAGRGSEVVRDQEIFRALSTNPADPRFVGGLLEESKLVRLSPPAPGPRPSVTAARHPGEPPPYVAMSRPGTDGEALTDYDVIGSNEEGTGLFALDRAGQLDLLCIPAEPDAERGITSFVAAERYGRQRHAMLIWDPPESWRSAGEVVAAMRAGTHTGRNALLYFPRIRRRGDAYRCPAGQPACGAVAGGIAAAESRGVWDREAAALLKTALTPIAAVDARDAATLRRFGVNVLEPTPEGATAILPRVTAAGAGASAWRDFRRRRLLLFILSSIEEDSASPWRRRGRAVGGAAGRIEEFLHALFARGAFAGAAPAQAFFAETVGTVVRFGVALRRGGEFTSFELDPDAAAPRLRGLPAVEADQLTR